jgi:alpha-1,2-mannosyltransferase
MSQDETEPPSVAKLNADTTHREALSHLNGQRAAAPNWFWWCLFLYGTALVIGLRVIPTFGHPLAQRDFSNLWVAGRLAVAGNPSAVFDIEAFRRATTDLLGFNFNNNYSYPPHALFLAVPFSILPFAPAFFAWNIFSLLLFYVAVKPTIPQGLPLAIVLLSPASLICLDFGHYGLLSGSLWLWAFRGSGLSAAALTIKPHLGLLVAVEMLRSRRALLIAILGTLALMVASALVFGINTWDAFLLDTFRYQVSLLDGSRIRLDTNMVTPFVSYGLFGQLGFAAAALLLLTRRFNVFTAATATFLILPYGFHYDMTVVCVGFAVLLASRWQQMRPWQRLVGGAGYLTPILVSFGSWIVPPVLLAGLFLQTELLSPRNEEETAFVGDLKTGRLRFSILRSLLGLGAGSEPPANIGRQHL